MGVTIEIYRSRIGSHHNFVEGQNLKSNFQGQFWNDMLLKFSISLLLPQNVKFRFNMMHTDNAQYDQCHVYNIVQLLLRLSSDVEENPGPTIDDIVDCSHTIHARFNQGNDIFGSNAGKQCVAMSLSAIVYKEVKSVNIWNQTTLNTIMVCGDNLYGTISRSINKNYLLLTDVPEFVDMNNITFHLGYSDSFSGALHMTVNNDPFVTLENALNEIFHSLNYKSCLLTIGMNTVVIMMPFPDVFKVFDSHSRDLYGMPSVSGYCVLISVEGIQNLVQYFHLTSQCNASSDYILFELKGVTCVRVMDLPNVNRQPVLSDNSENAGSLPNVNRQSVLSDNSENDGSLESENRGQRYAKSKEYNNFRKMRRQNESFKEKQARLEKQQLQKKRSGENESLEQREQRLAKMRECIYNRRDNKQQNESPQEKKARLEKQQLQKKRSRENESLEQREQRLAKMRECIYNRRDNKQQNESPQEKKARLEKQQLQKKRSRENESLEQRKQRLAKMREYVSNKEK